MKTTLFILTLLLCGGCKPTGSEPQTADTASDSSSCHAEKKPLMYKPSEMALLMEQMYAEHQAVRSKIVDVKPIGAFPKYYNNIKSATLTDPSDRDAFFDQKSIAYLEAEMALYNNPSVTNYNEAVQACLACHAEKCGGPVPRIKKLLIR